MFQLGGGKTAPFLSHLGVLIILIGAVVSALFCERGLLSISEGETVGAYATADGASVLPFGVRLDKFNAVAGAMDFKSDVTILDKGEEKMSATIEVNHPLKFKGYSLYQSQFSPEDPQWTGLEVVRDPGVYIVFAGFILLNVGVLIFFYRFALRPKVILIGMGSAVVAIVALGSYPPLIPALKSYWFLIHVPAYFAAYGALVVATIAAACGLDKLSYRLIVFSFPFLTIGLTTGAVWANAAWGRYWGWDPKETWALVTWLVYALYLHLRFIKGWRGKRMAAVAVVGFVFVVFTYFGVNFLLGGLHSYR